MRTPRYLTLLVFAIISCSQPDEPAETKRKVSGDNVFRLDQRTDEEVRILSKHPQIKQAFQYIEEEDTRTIKDLIMLTEIAAPPFKETLRGVKYLELLEAEELDSVWADSVGNVIGLRKGTKGNKVLALAAHLDTVFPEGTPLKVKEKGDTLFAPGIADDTRGLVTLLTTLRAMNAADIQTEDHILFVGNVGEEGLGDLRGVKHLFREGGPKIDFFISVDGTESESVTNGALGSHRYRITFRGPGGHSWGEFGLGNTHHALGAAIKYFADEADNYTLDGMKTSYNVGRIGGGTSVNSIPFESWMEVDMRSESPQRLAEIDTIMQQAIRKGLAEQNQLRRTGRPLTVGIKLIGNRPSGVTSPDDDLVQKAWASTIVFGIKPNLKTSSTDSNIPISKGIPAITIGGGGISKGAHSLGEYFINKNGPLGMQRVLLIVVAQSGLAKKINEL